jgi:EmrB/QacA subfamily drug resistance transporter
LYLDTSARRLPRVTPLSQNKKLLLVIVCLAQFMVVLDVSIVNVALPKIGDTLSFSTTGLEWVVNAYTLTFSGLLMLGGRAADLLGRRRVFLSGVGLFAFSSLLCAAASTKGLLVGGRALQGVGGAVMSPATLAIITTSFAEGAERNRALGVWGAMAGLGGSSGALLGGILTDGLGWPAIFSINVPLGIAVVMLGRRVIPEGRNVHATRNFDVAGATLVTGGLFAITYGIVRTDTLGWGSAGVLAPLAAGAALIGLFALVEGRFADAPLVPLSVFRMRQLRGANIAIFLMYAAMFALWFFLTLYLQQVLGFSAIEAGLSFLPMTLSVVAGSSIAPRLISRFGVRPAVSGALLVATAGMLLLTGVRPDGTYPAQVLPGGVLTMLALGVALVGSTIAAVQGVPESQTGLASGLLNTSRLMGGALGLAVLGTIAANHARSVTAASHAAALSDGYGLAFTVGAGFTVAGALVAAVMLRNPPTGPAEAQAGEDQAAEPLAA